MTLGGLALAVGILVDDATVTIENMERYLEEGQPTAQCDPAWRLADRGAGAGLDALHLHRVRADVPAAAAWRAICSCRLRKRWCSPCSRPTSCRARWCRRWRCICCAPSRTHLTPTRNPLVRVQRWFERGFERTRRAYHRTLVAAIVRRAAVHSGLPRLSALRSSRWRHGSARTSSPNTDSGQLILHMRAKTGTRIEETARLADLVETSIRRGRSGARTWTPSSTTSVCRTARINLTHSTSGVVGAADADILVSLKPGHRPTAGVCRRRSAKELTQQVPGHDRSIFCPPT